MADGWLHDLLVGGGGIITGLAPTLVRMTGGRAKRLEAMENRIMEKVEARNKVLEEKVAACESERGEMDTIKLCLRLAVPDMIRKDPRNPLLQLMGDALERSFGPVNADIHHIRELIEQLCQEPGADQGAIRARDSAIRRGDRDPTT